MGPLGRLKVGGLCLALAAASCGDLDAGSQPFVGTVLYQDPAGTFSLRLLEPPWLPPLTIQGQTFFIVPPSDATVSADPTVVLSEALYSLQVQRPAGAPADAMLSIKAALPVTAMAVQHPIRSASGAIGVELAWQESATMFHRDAFLAEAATPTFQLHFTAKHAIGDDAMVTQMIVSFDPK
jgi:hypothetical protein